MNICYLTGRLNRPANVFSDGKILKFLLVTQQHQRGKADQVRTSYVPCVIFDPTKELEEALVSNGSTKNQWEMQGRVVRVPYEAADGARRYGTEVVIDPATMCQVRE